jgi:arginase family enzyme
MHRTIVDNNLQLRKHTYQAFKDGYFPIVVGGDNTQILGSILGMKKFRPSAKAVILDSNIDINMYCEGTFSALEYLTGICGDKQHECLNLT